MTAARIRCSSGGAGRGGDTLRPYALGSAGDGDPAFHPDVLVVRAHVLVRAGGAERVRVGVARIEVARVPGAARPGVAALVVDDLHRRAHFHGAVARAELE